MTLDRWSLALALLIPVVGAVAFGGSAVMWASIGAGLVLAWAGWLWWYQTQGPGAVLRGLLKRWLELPGAQRVGRDGISVHDGFQRLRARLAMRRGKLRVILQTNVGQRPVAWRAWPDGTSAPTLDPGGAAVGGPPVERVAPLEARFAGTLRIESNAAPAAAGMLEGPVAAALLAAMHELPGQFAGVTYDGETLGVHFVGPVATDPQRCAALARAVWSELT